MKIFIIVLITAIASCWITGSVKDVKRVTKESIYYSDVTHRLKQSIESIQNDMEAGEMERMKEKIELLNAAIKTIPMNREGVSLHYLSEAYYLLDHPQTQESEPVVSRQLISLALIYTRTLRYTEKMNPDFLTAY